MNLRASHPADRFSPATIARTLLFIAGPLLCLVRLFGWQDSYVLTWPSPLAMLAATVAGAGIGAWLGWRLPFQGKPRSIRRFLVAGIAAIGWSLIGAYLLGWGVEVAAFAGTSPQQTEIEAPITGKLRSARRIQLLWIDVRTDYSTAPARLRGPRALFDSVDPESGTQCLLVRVEAGRGGVVRALLYPPPELVRCGERRQSSFLK